MIYERENELSLEEGYGIQLAPNSISILNKIKFSKLENNNFFNPSKLNFYSNDMTVAKDQLAQNHLKLTYQRNLVSDLDQKHKTWAKEDSAS